MAAGGVEARKGDVATFGEPVPDVPGPGRDEPVGVGLEHLDDVDLAPLERGGVVGHRSIGRPVERGGIDSGAVEVVEERHPGGRHVHRDRDAWPDEVLAAERGVGGAPHQNEGIAGDDLGETHERAGLAGPIRRVVVHHHPRRSSEGNVGAPLDEALSGLGRRGRETKLDLESLALEQPFDVGEVERGVAARPQVLVEDDLLSRHTCAPNRRVPFAHLACAGEDGPPPP